jgi:copper chaperone CopZ
VQEAQGSERVLRLEVAGMHCSGCASNISSSLLDVEGVKAAVADHEAGVVEVVHLPTKVEEDKVRERIHELGFTVTGRVPSGKVRT